MARAALTSRKSTVDRETQAGIRYLCQTDLWALAKTVLYAHEPVPMTETFHRPVCEWLQVSGKSKHLIMLPRGHYKTGIFTVARNIQRILTQPQTRILIASNKAENAEAMLSEIKGLLTTPILLWAFPDILVAEPERNAERWTAGQITVKRRRRTKEATVETIGELGEIVSKHYDFITYDDLVGQGNSQTREMLASTIAWWQKSQGLCEPHTVQDCIGTPWHYADLYGWMEQRTKAGEMDVAIYKRACWYNPDGTVPSTPGPSTVVSFPERWSIAALLEKKKDQGSAVFCTPADAPVVMADLTTKRIDDVRPGDEVLSFEEVSSRGPRSRRKIRVGRVIANHRFADAETVAIHLSSGKTLYSTPEHPWLRATDRMHRERGPFRFGAVGLRDRLCDWIDTEMPELTAGQMRHAGYLGAIFDGEGHARPYSVSIAQSTKMNPEVCDRIEQAMQALAIDYTIYDDQEGMRRYAIGGRSNVRRFLLACRPAKAERVLSALVHNQGVQNQGAPPRVLRIEPAGRTLVHSLETTTKTYFVYGFASHNSAQYQLDPQDDETAVFSRKHARIVPRRDVPPVDTLWVVMTVDPAISTQKWADYSAIATTGWDQDGRCWVLDLRRGRWTENETIAQMYLAHGRYPSTRAIGFEAIGFAKIYRQLLTREGQIRQQYLPVLSLERDTKTTKNVRIRTLQPLWENGEILLPDDLSALEDLLDEAARFRVYRESAHDDLLDALADSLQLRTMPGDPERPREYLLTDPEEVERLEFEQAVLDERQATGQGALDRASLRSAWAMHRRRQMMAEEREAMTGGVALGEFF